MFKHEEKDVRSDDEDDEAEEEEKKKIGPVPEKMNGKVNGNANEGHANGVVERKKEK